MAAREAVVAGAPLSRALADHDAVTPTVVRLARAGEESGTLGPMLARAAAMEAERAERLVRNAVRLLEPALILLFGGIVAFVAAALLQAVYSVRPT
jgi:type II secretory pathway component PulF